MLQLQKEGILVLICLSFYRPLGGGSDQGKVTVGAPGPFWVRRNGDFCGFWIRSQGGGWGEEGGEVAGRSGAREEVGGGRRAAGGGGVAGSREGLEGRR